MLSPNVTGNLTLENTATTHGEERRGRPDAFATAGGLEYLVSDDMKVTSRAEYRNATDQTSQLAELGLAAKLSCDYSLLSKARYFQDDFENRGTRNTSRFLLGLAYRPTTADRFNALTKLEYKHDTDDTMEFDTVTDTYIASIEGVYQATEDMQVIGKYAGKLADSGEYRTYTDLVSARIIYDLTDRFDVGLGYRLLTSHETSTMSHGGSAEIGYRLWKDLWLSVGYSLDRFDADLTGSEYQGKGPYLRLRFKFDEHTVRDAGKALRGRDPRI
jgi:hypothetical protein